MTTPARPIAAAGDRGVEHPPDLGSQEVPRRGGGRRLGRAFVFLWFLIGGIAYFAATETELRLVPPYIPWPLAAVWVSGAFEFWAPSACSFCEPGAQQASGSSS